MSRKQKAIWEMVIIAVSALIFFLLSDIPSLTPWCAFRHAERQNLIGPSDILGTNKVRMLLYDRIMLGESEHGYTLFLYSTENSLDYSSKMTYIPKDGDITLAAVATPFPVENKKDHLVPFFVFTDHKNAASATLTLHLTRNPLEDTFTLEGSKCRGNYFVFWIDSKLMSGEAFYCYNQAISYPQMEYSVEASTVLFDKNGEQLEAKTKDMTWWIISE